MSFTGTPSTPVRTAPAGLAPDPAPIRGAGWASLIQGLLLFVPVAVLGSAIGWPASLGDPASVMLPKLLDQEAAVRAGYLVYLAYSILFGITMVLLLRLAEGVIPAGMRRLAIGFAIASVVARCIGIVRWLGPMPVLADAYRSAADDSQRYAVSQGYELLNSYGGTIGEALGVGLFAAASLGILAVGLLRDRRIPRWLAGGAVLASVAVLLNVVELGGADLGALISVTVTIVQVWFIATGIWLLSRGQRLA
jgi:hypothetical protein